jgi:hypothetical protein
MVQWRACNLQHIFNNIIVEGYSSIIIQSLRRIQCGENIDLVSNNWHHSTKFHKFHSLWVSSLPLFLLEHQALKVHHTSPEFSFLIGRTIPWYIRLGDQPIHYISQLSSQRAYHLDSRPTIEDSQAMDWPKKQSTMNWMCRWSGQASSLSRLENEDLVKSTLTTNVTCGQDLPHFVEFGYILKL